MDLKTPDGFELIKTEELKKLNEIADFIKDKGVIPSLSSAWRKIEKLEKMLKEVFNGQVTK